MQRDEYESDEGQDEEDGEDIENGIEEGGDGDDGDDREGSVGNGWNKGHQADDQNDSASTAVNELPASITWARSETNPLDGDVLEYHSRPLSIKRFKDAVNEIITEAEDILWQELMWVSQKEDRFRSISMPSTTICRTQRAGLLGSRTRPMALRIRGSG